MKKENSGRLFLIDAYRGFVVLAMIAFHFCYDAYVIFMGRYDWPLLKPVFIWEQFICISFNLISGFVWVYGKKNCIKRGVIVNLCGLLVTFVTFIAMPEAPIIYGVLTFLGCAMIIMLPLSKLLDRIPALYVLLFSLILFIFTFGISRGGFGIYSHVLIRLPEAFYEYDILTPLGFPKKGFISSDYFPLIPWIFLYVCGYALNRLLSKKTEFMRFASKKIPVLSFVGMHSLIIYMIHQPLCMLVCILLFR